MDKLKMLNEMVSSCCRCRLCSARNSFVFGEGNPEAELMFIGEGPGAEEDRTGRPFVGKAGQLLTRMIEVIGVKRQDVYIANIVKCRPPQNRAPEEDEAQACLPILRQQVAIIRPRIIVCLGSTSAKYIIDKDIRITKQRGQWYQKGSFMIMPTYHPSALLRDESKKKDAWEDFKSIREKMETI